MTARRARATCMSLLVSLFTTSATTVIAATSVTLSDADGQPLAAVGVAIYLDQAAQSTDVAAPEPAVIDQRNEQFAPNFLVIRAGTEVSFPNSDRVLHHVYSFSPANVFELPLYRGVLPPPIKFEREGIVTIGCNIHDHMIGHVWVVDTSLFALTDANGRATFDHVPLGSHRVMAWHPRLGKTGIVSKQMVVTSDAHDAELVVAIAPTTSQSRALSWHDAY